MKRSVGAIEAAFGIAVALLAVVMVVTASAPARVAEQSADQENESPSGAPSHIAAFTVDDPVVSYGEVTRFAGEISPARSNEMVELIDSSGHALVRLETGEDGKFAVRISPLRSESITAVWGDASSAPIFVEVKPQARVSLRGVHSGRAEVTGRVRPTLAGATAALTITRNGRPIVTKVLDVEEAGAFSFDFPVRKPGSYLAELRYSSPGSQPVRVLSETQAR